MKSDNVYLVCKQEHLPLPDVDVFGDPRILPNGELVIEGRLRTEAAVERLKSMGVAVLSQEVVRKYIDDVQETEQSVKPKKKVKVNED